MTLTFYNCCCCYYLGMLFLSSSFSLPAIWPFASFCLFGLLHQNPYFRPQCPYFLSSSRHIWQPAASIAHSHHRLSSWRFEYMLRLQKIARLPATNHILLPELERSLCNEVEEGALFGRCHILVALCCQIDEYLLVLAITSELLFYFCTTRLHFSYRWLFTKKHI